jgi:hypothetical protein
MFDATMEGFGLGDGGGHWWLMAKLRHDFECRAFGYSGGPRRP